MTVNDSYNERTMRGTKVAAFFVLGSSAQVRRKPPTTDEVTPRKRLSAVLLNKLF